MSRFGMNARAARWGSARMLWVVALGVAGLLVAAPAARATLVTLTDENSSVDFDTQSQLGVYNWNIDGTDVLKKQWFWYRVGNVNPESSIDTIPQTSLTASDGNGDGFNDSLTVVYTAAGFTLNTRYLLTGGSVGSDSSDLAETLKITNTSTAPLVFHFYQYVDLDLSAADSVSFTNSNTAVQTGGGFSSVETVFSPVASHREANFFPVTLGKLNDGVPTTLNDVLTAGPGDVTWANQWDVTIAAGKSFIISKDKNVQIPEPTALALLGGSMMLFAMRRNRSTAK